MQMESAKCLEAAAVLLLPGVHQSHSLQRCFELGRRQKEHSSQGQEGGRCLGCRAHAGLTLRPWPRWRA